MTQDELKEILEYNPDTGVFRWASRRPKIRVGEIAGTGIPSQQNGRVMITIDGRRYAAHRLAWLYVYGRWPCDQIDHIDLDRANNRIGNLREATNSQNCANRRHFGKSGRKGVSWNTTAKKWHAQITFQKRCISLGYFDLVEDAHLAYAEKAKALHGEFARTS